jgi:cytochrome c-type biogenesis protein CcmH/NrfG
VGFWRREVIEPALDDETERLVRQQRDWIAREPGNGQPYYRLALLYRMQWKQDEALGLLLEAVRLDPALAAAHVSLAEVYAVRDDPRSAWRHALLAQQHGDPAAVQMLRRNNVANPDQAPI